ncbi:DUF6247 family protein [Allonocardiopsis opalescens]|uniref:Uncharacterized protein n=1 Tax=Allonocardiopsis opalescens TaxID=1144618 RepID=A0A2T0PWY6_9ACTN|nr:DUF6247 family protein [Allonocardiopsis opalescens]PRX96053.1 hypothetical protein CLV72_10857 [Allonocardiopsis opalescens]
MVSSAIRLFVALLRHSGASRTILHDVAREIFPWIRFLPPADAEAFLAELADVLRAAQDIDNPGPAMQCVVEWRHTAEAHAAPDVREVLVRGEYDDLGPVPPPAAER